MKQFLLTTFVLILAFGSMVYAQSPLDGLEVNVNGSIADIAVQADGKIIIGGSFTQVNGVNRNYLARLNANRTVDTTFNPNPNASVYTLLIQPNGKILIGGIFSTVGGQSKPAIARLETDGTVDDLYAGISGWVNAIALEGNGNILIGGYFIFGYGGGTGKNLARLDATFGYIDESFITDPEGGVTGGINSIVVLQNGGILVGGYFSTIKGVPRNDLAILDPISGNPNSFNPFPILSSRVNSMVVQPNGKVLVAGELLDGRVAKKIARIDLLTGVEDPTFSATFSGETENPGSVFSIAIQPNTAGKILVGGDFFTVNGQPRFNLARLNNNGSLDTAFTASNPNGGVGSFAVQPSGKVLIGGGFTSVNGQVRNHFAGLEVNGELDKTLDLGTLNGLVRIIVPQPDGKIIIAGDFTTLLGVSRNHIARLNPDGSLDSTFNPNQIGLWRIFAVALDSVGRIYVGGEFLDIGGQHREHLARLNPITGNADSFNPSVPDYVLSICIDSNDDVIVGGGAAFSHVARFDHTTGDQEFFYPVPNGDVEAILELPGGKILLGGLFTQLSPDGGSTETRNHIALVNSDGTLDSTFNLNIQNSGFTAHIYAMKLQADGKIVVGGLFTQIDAAARNNIARINADGTLDTAFNPNANSQINSITIQSNGKILITGGFNQVGGLPRNRVARLNEVDGHPEFIGGIIDQYDPNVNGIVYASAIQADGKVLIGGDFSDVGGTSRSNFARLTNDTYAVSEMTISRNVISWQVDGSTPQFNRVRFELSTDDGQTYSFLGNGMSNLISANNGKSSPNSPQANTFTLSGLNLPNNQSIIIRASGDSSTEKQQSAFLLAPTASNASISGRVLTSNGRGLNNAFVLLTDSSGNTLTTRTNTFGYYRFNEIESGQTVIIAVNSKRFQYQPRVISVDENLSYIEFVPIGNNSKQN